MFLKFILSIGSAVAVLQIMVWPKIIRVYRGEKVVMNALFQSKFNGFGDYNSSNYDSKYHLSKSNYLGSVITNNNDFDNIDDGVVTSTTTDAAADTATLEQHNYNQVMNVDDTESETIVHDSNDTKTSNRRHVLFSSATSTEGNGSIDKIDNHHRHGQETNDDNDKHNNNTVLTIIREGDPLPSKLERHIHQLQQLLRDITSQI